MLAEDRHRRWTLPVPASFVVDRDGTVRFSHVDPDYTIRPEGQVILDTVRALS